ncbi:hypothetical protein VKI21_06830 [Cyanobacterium aponinum UTEX 3222]|uniref:hypothetical protein n=1 Tax=Cyanobacterium aponinum TaxID=379064 RepID=UPI00308CD36F|nr:hypothetical protein VKI21_06830 [Cyanobacterium aponinum UTEX 3222]
MRLIRCTALSKILLKPSYYVTQYIVKHGRIGLIVDDGIAYLNLDYALCIGEKLSIHSTRNKDEILEEIRNYDP